MRKLHHDEYNVFSLRRVAKRAGLPNARIWIDPDLTRSNNHSYGERLAHSRLVRFVDWWGRWSVARFFLGNDIYLMCTK